MDAEPKTLQSLKDIAQIPESSEIPKTREKLASLVESPVRTACLEFYDKNIRTVMSSANKKDLTVGYGYISIDYDHLSEPNKKVAEEIAVIEPPRALGYSTIARLKFPVTKDTTQADIEKASKEAVKKFEKQKMTWVPRYTLQELDEIYFAPKGEYGPDDYAKEDYYYDPNEGFFYNSEEHY